MVFIKHNEIENKKYVLLEFLCSKCDVKIILYIHKNNIDVR